MIQWYIICGQTVVIVLAIVGVSVRLEHRITKIETDVTWIKELAKSNCNDSEREKEG